MYKKFLGFILLVFLTLGMSVAVFATEQTQDNYVLDEIEVYLNFVRCHDPNSGFDYVAHVLISEDGTVIDIASNPRQRIHIVGFMGVHIGMNDANSFTLIVQNVSSSIYLNNIMYDLLINRIGPLQPRWTLGSLGPGRELRQSFYYHRYQGAQIMVVATPSSFVGHLPSVTLHWDNPFL